MFIKTEETKQDRYSSPAVTTSGSESSPTGNFTISRNAILSTICLIILDFFLLK